MANWFEYLNKDKLVLKKYYDLKLISSNSNNSGDSGVGDFICMSASSSSTNSSLSVSTHNNPNTNGYNLIEAFLCKINCCDIKRYSCFITVK